MIDNVKRVAFLYGKRKGGGYRVDEEGKALQMTQQESRGLELLVSLFNDFSHNGYLGSVGIRQVGI
jgi:hypothetical protein